MECELVFLNPEWRHTVTDQSKREIEHIVRKYEGSLATTITIKAIENEFDMWCASNNIEKSEYEIVWR
jgi:hypothetical protein